MLAQDAVVCFSGEGCTGDDLGALSPTECCVEAAAGRSFRRPGQEICSTCVGKSTVICSSLSHLIFACIY